MIGKLQWAMAVISAGHAFLRRLTDQTIGVVKPHYYIRVTEEVRKDLAVWLEFFLKHNGKTFFWPRRAETSQTLNLFTDASSVEAAGICGSQWFWFADPKEWAAVNITFLQLFPIMVALSVFSDMFSNSAVIFDTDN